jgi:uncharacterized protein
MAASVSTPVTELRGQPAASAPPAAAPSIGDPGALGLACFGITTLCLSVINAGWLNNFAGPMVLAVCLPFGGVTQILAGMWAFRKGNTFAGTAFSAYGAFWISFFLLLNYFVPAMATSITGSKGAVGLTVLSGAVGLYLLAWGIFTAYMLVAALKTNTALTAVFGFLTVTFFVLAIGWFALSSSDVVTIVATGKLTGIINAGGYLGILTAIGALYVSFADITKATFNRAILPT